jgi:tetratricopeptide (TPR) repeat protein
LKPDYAEAHCNLGQCLDDQGRHAAAEASYRQAIALNPDLVEAHQSMGVMLMRQEGRLTEALATFREAIKLKPSARDHYNVGNILATFGRDSEAEEAYRSAVKLWPDYAQAHCNLADMLVKRGNFSEAVEEYRLGHEFGSKQKNWPYRSAQWVRDAERMAALAPRLPGLLTGESQPADAAERVTLAQIFHKHKTRKAAAAELYATAFAAEQKLADDVDSYRYAAARTAALAACGQGEDAATLNDAGRTRLRRQALDWLTAELTAWGTRIDDAADRPRVRNAMQRWQGSSDLAGVRDAAALAKLPEAERAAWQKLWADVADLLKRTYEPPAAKPPAP